MVFFYLLLENIVQTCVSNRVVRACISNEYWQAQMLEPCL